MNSGHTDGCACSVCQQVRQGQTYANLTQNPNQALVAHAQASATNQGAQVYSLDRSAPLAPSPVAEPKLREDIITDNMRLKDENKALLVENAQLRRQVEKLTARKPGRAT